MRTKKQHLSDQDWYDWHATIDPERQSLLLHEDAPADMFKANGDIQWDDLAGRLQDVEYPELLFDGHDTLKNHVSAIFLRTIPAVALITVSLNNYVARNNLPCKNSLYSSVKFSWSHIPLSLGESGAFTAWGHPPLSPGESDIFMAFGAWSTKEQKDWISMSPAYRAKRCTVWESTIRHSSQAIQIPYSRKKQVSFFRSGAPMIMSNAIVWAAECVREDGEKDAGELFLQWRAVDAHRGQCTTNKKLFNVMRKYYLEASSQRPWHIWRLKAITAIHNRRKSTRRHTTTFWSKVEEKIAGVPPMVKK